MAESCIEVRFTQLWVIAILNTNISQGNVATRLRCGGIFSYCFISHLVISLSVKEFLKLVSIWFKL